MASISPPQLSPAHSQLIQRATPWLLLLLILLAYAPALSNGYVWDDDFYVTDNVALRDLEGLRDIWLTPKATPQYYPLVFTTFWLEYQAWGLAPAGYHLVNLLLHVAVAFLWWRVLQAIGLDARVAVVAAFLFAAHPVHVESVAWITERKNVLSGAWYLAAALAWFRFWPLAQCGFPQAPRWRWFALAMLLYLAALLSKTVTVTLPAAILLAVWYRHGHFTRRHLAWTAPMFVLGATFGLVTVWMETTHVGASGENWSATPPERLIIAGRALWFYAWTLVWPAELIFTYPRWQIDAGAIWQWAFPAGAISIMVLLWALRRRIGRGPLAAVLYFAGTLFPALGFFNVFPMVYSYVADHFQYLASMGILVLAAAALVRGGDSLTRRPSDASGPAPLASLVLAGAVTCLLAIRSYAQTHHYKDAETLWRHTIAHNPDAFMAHNNLGVILQQQGRPDLALESFRRALDAQPEYAEALTNIGNLLLQRGRIREAVDYYRRALASREAFFNAHYNLGAALEALGHYAEALDHFERASELLPGSALPLARQAWLLATAGDADVRSAARALALAQQTLEIAGPDDPEAYRILAAAEAEAGNFDAARSHLDRAASLGSLNPHIPQQREAYAAGRPWYQPRQPIRETATPP